MTFSLGMSHYRYHVCKYSYKVRCDCQIGPRYTGAGARGEQLNIGEVPLVRVIDIHELSNPNIYRPIATF